MEQCDDEEGLRLILLEQLEARIMQLGNAARPELANCTFHRVTKSEDPTDTRALANRWHASNNNPEASTKRALHPKRMIRQIGVIGT